MQRNCNACGTPYEARSSRSKYCADPDCKRARERARKNGTGGQVVTFPTPDLPAGPNEQVTRAALEEAGRLRTVAGQNALTLAQRLDRAAGDTGSAFAQLAKQHMAAVDRALEGVAAAEDPIERRRRAAHERRLSVVR